MQGFEAAILAPAPAVGTLSTSRREVEAARSAVEEPQVCPRSAPDDLDDSVADSLDSLMQPQRIAPSHSRSRPRLQRFEATVLGFDADFNSAGYEASSSSYAPDTLNHQHRGASTPSSISSSEPQGRSPSSASLIVQSRPEAALESTRTPRQEMQSTRQLETIASSADFVVRSSPDPILRFESMLNRQPPRPTSPLMSITAREEPLTMVPGLGPLGPRQRQQLENFLNGAPNSEIDISLLPDLSHLSHEQLWQLGNFLSEDSSTVAAPVEEAVPSMVATNTEVQVSQASESTAGHGKACWRINELEFRKLFTKAKAAPRDQECAICYQPLHATCVALPCMEHGCGSFFHGVCIRPWLVRNPSCPLCRHPMRELVKPIISGLRAADRCPLAEFWLIELEEEASPWLRREREGRDDGQVISSASATTLRPAADLSEETAHPQRSASQSHLYASGSPSSSQGSTVTASTPPRSPVAHVPPLGPAPASFATLITGAPRPPIATGLSRRPAQHSNGNHGDIESRRASSSGSGSSGSGSRSSSRLSFSLADPSLTREARRWRLRPAGQAVLCPGLGQRAPVLNSPSL